MQACEVQLDWYIYEDKCKVQLAYVGEEIAGLSIWKRVFDDAIAVRFQYVKPEFLKENLGFGMVDSITPKPLWVYFQTQNKSESEAMSEAVSKHRQKLYADEKLTTWLMPWKSKGETL